jgi:hypothetical protein
VIGWANLNPLERESLIALAAMHKELGPGSLFTSDAVGVVVGRPVVAELGFLAQYGLIELTRRVRAGEGPGPGSPVLRRVPCSAGGRGGPYLRALSEPGPIQAREAVRGVPSRGEGGAGRIQAPMDT